MDYGLTLLLLWVLGSLIKNKCLLNEEKALIVTEFILSAAGLSDLVVIGQAKSVNMPECFGYNKNGERFKFLIQFVLKEHVTLNSSIGEDVKFPLEPLTFVQRELAKFVKGTKQYMNTAGASPTIQKGVAEFNLCHVNALDHIIGAFLLPFQPDWLGAAKKNLRLLTQN